MQLYALPQIEHLQPRIILHQDGAPPQWGVQVRACLDRTFPGRWIGRDGRMPWPPRSPDITRLDFFLSRAIIFFFCRMEAQVPEIMDMDAYNPVC
jgi:hypothetical protein